MTHNKHIIGFFVVLTVGVLGCKSDKLSMAKQEDLIVKGKEIASATFVALSSELQNAMSDGGVENAVKYCNLKAMPITDSLAIKYNVEIRRTSDKIRNLSNKASAQELKTIANYKKSLLEGKQLKHQVVSHNDEYTFYAPILINDMCLKCHGNKSDISSYDVITNLYPNDLATGYKSGQVRGIWSINFLK